LARLAHPNVVTIFDVGTHEESVFLAMELVDGQSLSEWLQGQHTIDEVLRTFQAAGRGLEAAHAIGLVHRDFKPDNVLVGNDGRTRVVDFGLVRPAQEVEPTSVVDVASADIVDGINLLAGDLTRTGTIMGTPAYMAPEQFDGRQADARSDLFSFCVSLYQAVFGSRPFAGTSLSEIARNVTTQQVQTPTLKDPRRAPLWPILQRGLRAPSTERYESMSDLLADLEGAAQIRRSPRVAWVVGATLAIGVTLLAIGSLLREPSTVENVRAPERNHEIPPEIHAEESETWWTYRRIDELTRVQAADEAGEYPGQRLDIDLYSIEIRDLIQSLAQTAKKNISVAPEVHARVQVRLQQKPWDYVLDFVLASHGFSAVPEGSGLRVATWGQLKREYEERVALLQPEQRARLVVPSGSRAQILVDGWHLGQVPRAGPFATTPGLHRVSFVVTRWDDEGIAQSRQVHHLDVELEAGKTRTIDLDRLIAESGSATPDSPTAKRR
ncbi:MAG: protein kinase, partial [Deltaproteobacteria bacterium]|nr:protein kinase [Deltaproteobacteria bacterium]